MITLGPGRAAAMAHLAAAGFSPKLAGPTLVLGALFDYFIGLVLLVRPAARYALYAMIVATGCYLLIGTVLLPQLWLDPLGPYLKIVPVMIAMLFTLAILDER